MVTIPQSYAVGASLLLVDKGLALNGSAVGTALAWVSYPHLFIVAFSPILGALLCMLGWRAWKALNKSQR